MPAILMDTRTSSDLADGISKLDIPSERADRCHDPGRRSTRGRGNRRCRNICLIGQLQYSLAFRRVRNGFCSSTIWRQESQGFLYQQLRPYSRSMPCDGSMVGHLINRCFARPRSGQHSLPTVANWALRKIRSKQYVLPASFYPKRNRKVVCIHWRKSTWRISQRNRFAKVSHRTFKRSIRGRQRHDITAHVRSDSRKQVFLRECEL